MGWARHGRVLLVMSVLLTAVTVVEVLAGGHPPVAHADDVTPPPPPPPPEPPIVGFIDTHLHQFGNEGFGGLEMWGSPMDPLLDPTASESVGASRALPPSDYLYVSDDAVDGFLGLAGLPARFSPTSSSCIADCDPRCPPGSGTEESPCWKLAIHGENGMLDVLNMAVGGKDSHGTSGYPDMEGWPAWDVYTTQQAYYTWLEHAHQHGLKSITMLAVNNSVLCGAGYRRVSYGCDDDSSVIRQIEGAKDLEQYIDARAGGPGQGFYRIVYSGEEARAAIADGKLAVQLGVEVDTPWGCTVNATFCDAAYIETKVTAYDDLGVRVFYPVHLADNRFGGAALYNSMFDVNNYLINGEFFHVTTDCPAGTEFRLSLRDTIESIKPAVIAALVGIILGPAIIPILAPIIAPLLLIPLVAVVLPLLVGALAVAAPALAPILPLAAMVFLVPDAPGSAGAAPDPPDPNCNERGLTGEGEVLINALIDHEMLIDVDHTGARTFDGILDIAEARSYAGIVSGHTGLAGTGLTRAASLAMFPGTEFDLGESALHEGNKTDAQIQRITDLGGVVNVIVHQGGRGRLKEYQTVSGDTPVPFDCGNSSQSWAEVYLYATDHLGLDSVGIGSDFNGFAGWAAPRFGPDACGHDADHPASYAPTNPIAYPFTDHFGQSVDQYQFGSHTWNYNTDGLAHVGLYPDFVQDLERGGLTPAQLGPLFNSAEAFVKMWEKVGDHAAPSVACGTVGEAWHSSDVTVPCVAWDTGAGLLDAADGSFALSTSVAAGTETGNATTGTHPAICDQARNCTATVPAITGINVDKKPPDVTLTNPLDGATYIINEHQAANFGCADGGSGLLSCTAPVSNLADIDTSVGVHTFTVTGTDMVQNSASRSATYTVTYRICLLYDPLKESGRPGSVVSIKLRLCDAQGANLSSPSISVRAVALDGAPPPPNAAGNSNTDYFFRLDGSAQSYIYNLKTTGLTAGTHVVAVSIQGDPVASHLITFRLK